MRTHVAGYAVEVTRPESPKFHHPLLLLHGLWTDAWIWERFATYLAHRGWESWAPALTAATAIDSAPALAPIIAALPSTPVVIAHDVATLGAAACAARGIVSAVVATHVASPRGSAARVFLGEAITHRERLRDDSGPAFRAVASGGVRLPPRIDVPGLVVGGERDVVAPDAAMRAVATRFGWTRRAYAGRGHFPMLEPGWENVADDVHRWIVQTLGAELLAFLDEEEDPQ